MRHSAQCENEKFDIDLQQRMDEQTPNKNILQKLSGIHKLDKASKVYKGLATADVYRGKKFQENPVFSG
jgi:hypothetical protein